MLITIDPIRTLTYTHKPVDTHTHTHTHKPVDTHPHTQTHKLVDNKLTFDGKTATELDSTNTSNSLIPSTFLSHT